jgi:hypothetical protein
MISVERVRVPVRTRAIIDTGRKAGRWVAAHPFVVSLVWALWLSALYGAFGAHSYVRLHDNADGPLAARAGLNVLVGGWDWLTSWARSWASGVDRGVNDLDALLFVFLPGWFAYFLLMFGQRLLAAYFGFRLMRDRLRTGVPAALFMALTFSAFQQNRIQSSWAGWTIYDGLTFAAVPAIAWLLLSPGMSRRRRLLLAAAAGALYALTSIYAFSAFMVVLLPAVVLMVEDRPRDLWLALLVFVGAWVVAESPAVIAGVLNSTQTQRASWAIGDGGGHTLRGQFDYARQIAWENVTGLALGVWAATGARDRRARIAIAVAVVALAGVLAAPQLQELLKTYGGPLAGFQAQRIFFWVPPMAAIAGALGVEALTKAPARAALRLIGYAGVAVVVVLSVGVNQQIAREMMAGSNYAVIYQDPALLSLGRSEATSTEPFRVATVATGMRKTIPVSPAYAWADGIDTADGYLSLYPKRYQDFWARVIAPIAARDSVVRNYFGAWGNRIYLFVSATDRADATFAARDYWNLDLLALDNVRYVLSGVKLDDPRLRQVAAPGVQPQPIMSRRRWLAQLLGAPIVSRYYVYELAGALPRAFVVSSLRSFATRGTLLDALASAPVGDLGSTAFFEATDGPLPPVSGGGTAGPMRIRGDRRDIVVRADAATVLVVTEQYNRYWTATVDGSAVRIVPVDGAFMAVPVPSGAHTVTLSYRPPYALAPVR